MNGNGLKRPYEVLLLSFALATACTTAAEWRNVARSDLHSDVAVDTGSLKRDGAIARARTKWEVYDPQRLTENPDTPYLSSDQLEYYNCESGAWAWKTVTFYTGRNLSGRVVRHVTKPDADLVWKDAALDSVGKDLIEYVCSQTALE
jgi:hypothetical protein